ncbi:MAG: ATP-binding protein [Cyclobacteriaceae bacterium]
MIFNRFSILLIFRLALVFLNLVTLAKIFGRSDLFFNQVILYIILAIQMYELLHFVTRTNRDLTKFIMSIKEADFTASFTGGPRDKSYKHLYESFREILETIRKSKFEKEAQYQYLQTIIDRINIGIISIDDNGNIELMNKKSQEVLQVPYVKSWQLLKNANTRFFEEVGEFKNEENRLVEVPVDGVNKQLTVNVTEVKVMNRAVRVITFKDIKSELERKEIEAWHKLIRILTHEIMNSVTPITSLTDTMTRMLEKVADDRKSLKEIDSETVDDLRFSISTIHNRSEGLLHFVNDYRKLTKVPQPVLVDMKLADIVRGVVRLMETELMKSQIEVSIFLDDTLMVQVDLKLIEQVLINLITNAIHALEETSKPSLILKSEVDGENRNTLQIIDNGAGIDADKIEKIFVPFFSTKENGSGIGLSLCQQIMNLHQGHIEVQSESGRGTTFRLIF